MKISTKRALIFILTFLATVIINSLFFAGVSSSIQPEKIAWLLDSFILSILLCFLLFLGIPSLVSYYVAFKLYRKDKKPQTKFALLITFIFAVLFFIFFKTAMQPKFAPYTLYEISEDEFAEPPATSSATPVDIFPSPFPTATFEFTPTNAPTSTPTRTPNPPRINISYPTEMQSIEMNTTQTFCMVDIPAGGDHSGVQRRHNINDSGWIGYSDTFTLCFNPQEGLNRIQLQYRNSYGDESTIYTRQFNFHRLEDITVTLSGQIYRDENCNGIRDGGEVNISIGATVNIWKPSYILFSTISSNSNGFFSFFTEIRENESITLFSTITSPFGYSGSPHYQEPSFTLNSNNRAASVDCPQVPNEFVGECY